MSENADRQGAVTPDDLARWWLRMREAVRGTGMTGLEVLDDLVEHHARRLRRGGLGETLLVGLATTAVSVTLTVALTALLSRLLPAPSPVVAK